VGIEVFGTEEGYQNKLKFVRIARDGGVVLVFVCHWGEKVRKKIGVWAWIYDSTSIVGRSMKKGRE